MKQRTPGRIRKLIDRVAHRFGYIHITQTIQGEIRYELGEQRFVDLKLPGPIGNQRVYGWVDSRLGVTKHIINPALGRCCAGGPQWGHAWDCPKCPD